MIYFLAGLVTGVLVPYFFAMRNFERLSPEQQARFDAVCNEIDEELSK